VQYTLTYQAQAGDAGKYLGICFSNPGAASTWGQFDDFSLSVIPATLPSPWATADIGMVGVAGSVNYTNGLFSVTGSGSNLWSTADSFHYVYQPGSGDCSIQAEVLTVQNTRTNAMGGVMIREALSTNSAMATMVITPTAGTENIWRTNTSGQAVSNLVANIAAPNWVQVTRTGNSFVGYYSTNGTTWNAVKTNVFTMATNVYIGLVVCAHNNTTNCTATFTNVVATP
jgi:regulation of enolase protein 1 (concanavalin A-like superfamily)